MLIQHCKERCQQWQIKFKQVIYIGKFDSIPKLIKQNPLVHSFIPASAYLRSIQKSFQAATLNLTPFSIFLFD